ncbi:MAG: DUF177 domain-containing protein [Rubrivivax sp.]
MKAREFDARRLDVRAFAKAAASLSGQWPLSSFERLGDQLAAVPVDALVGWKVEGQAQDLRGGASQTWLHIEAEATLPLSCQRCLEPVAQPVRVDRRYLFVRDEAEAARLDGEIEEDVLVATRELDLHELLEDELLLDLPLVPRHAHCKGPQALPAPGDDSAAGEPPERLRPFQALGALRRRG